MKFAGANGLRVAAQGTGHGANALTSLDGVVLVKTDRMRGVSVDPAARRARVEAGVLGGELGPAAARARAHLARAARLRTWGSSASRSGVGSAG